MSNLVESVVTANRQALSKIVELALQQYNLKKTQVRLISKNRGIKFKVQTSSDTFVLRVHDKQALQTEKIRSELRLLKHLSRDGFEIFPNPVMTKNGELFLTLSLPVDRLNLYCSLLTWVNGNVWNPRLLPNRLEDVGECVGNFHRLAHGFKCGPVESWLAAGLFERLDLDKLKIKGRMKSRLLEIKKATANKIRQYETRFPDRIGPIHADLVQGNVLLDVKKVRLIDFEYWVRGSYALDLAILIENCQSKLSQSKRYSSGEIQDRILKGYVKHREWGKCDVEILPFVAVAHKFYSLSRFEGSMDDILGEKWVEYWLGKIIELSKNID